MPLGVESLFWQQHCLHPAPTLSPTVRAVGLMSSPLVQDEYHTSCLLLPGGMCAQCKMLLAENAYQSFQQLELISGLDSVAIANGIPVAKILHGAMKCVYTITGDNVG